MKTPPDPEAAARWRGARRLLLVRLDNLGDLLMTTPAFAAVRNSLPDARLTLLTSAAGAAAARHLPGIDMAIPFAASWVTPRSGDTATGGLGENELRMANRLAVERFDGAIIFTVCTQSALPAALLCRLAGIPLRLAYSRENPYGLLSDWLPECDFVGEGMRHEVERQLALVAAVGLHSGDARLRFSYGVEHVRRLQECMLAAGHDPVRPYFIVHPGASAASRRYPAEQFGAAADIIVRESGCAAIYTGGDGEAAIVEQARAAMGWPSLSLAGRLGLGELAALIAGAEVLVTNNTGPVHIAAAVSTPVVDLYALTNPQHTPWRVLARVLNHDVPCRWCLKSECPEGHHDCLRKVEPERVAAAALELMGAGPAIPVQ